MNILIVEDEKELSDSICDYLASEHFTCEPVYNFDEASDKIALYDYACIVLDIGLPGGSGITLLKELKEANKLAGVLIVSAKASLEDKLEGLKSGADDYLTKPFHLSELTARVEAIIRRKSFDGSNIVRFGALELDLNQRLATLDQVKLELTRKEYQLLVYFISNKNKVISKSAIAIHLWGDDMDIAGNYDFIYTHIKNLRKKLAQVGVDNYLQSLYGMGYKFSEK